MCKIEKVLETKVQKIPIGEVQKKGLSYDHIRYNTDLVFSIAKKLEIPIDDAIMRIKHTDNLKTFNNAYSKRNRIRKKTVVDILTSDIEGI